MKRKTLAKEKWDKSLKDMIPEIRNFIMMQSRQSGKCLFNSYILLQYPNNTKVKINTCMPCLPSCSRQSGNTQNSKQKMNNF